MSQINMRPDILIVTPKRARARVTERASGTRLTGAEETASLAVRRAVARYPYSFAAKVGAQPGPRPRL